MKHYRRILFTVFALLATTVGSQVLARGLPINMAIGTNLSAGPPGGPTAAGFVDEIRPFACLRFMDWQGTVALGGGWGRAVSDEGCVAACNAAGADGWFCVRHDMGDDYVRGLAQLIHDQLDPGLKAYIEYSNETWNTAKYWYPALHYAASLATDAGIVPSHLQNDERLVAAYGHVYRAVQIWRIFMDVFGSEMSTRVVKVIAGQAMNTGLQGVHQQALKDENVNPDGLLMDAYAIAPYFGAETYSGAAAAAALVGQVNVGGQLKKLLTEYNDVTGANAVLVAYEGGSHFNSGNQSFRYSQDAYDIMKDYLDRIAPFIELFCHYTYTCGDANWNTAGSPVYDALVDWAEENPYTPPTTAGRRDPRVLTTAPLTVAPSREPATHVITLLGRGVSGISGLPQGIAHQLVLHLYGAAGSTRKAPTSCVYTFPAE